MNAKRNYAKFLKSHRIVVKYLKLFRTMTHQELKDFFNGVLVIYEIKRCEI